MYSASKSIAMQKDLLIPLNIVIGDRNYRIKILTKDEEVIRRTLKIINDKILEFRSQYSGKDMQDYIAMVLIWYATEGKENKNEISPDILDALLKMEKLLDEKVG